MAISDAQFLQWLRSGASNITVLAEPRVAYQRSGAVAEDVLYLADKPFRTKASDTVPFRQYRDVIQSAPNFSRGIDIDKLGGRGVSSAGNLSLHNTDGVVDFLLDSIIDGRSIPFYVGDFDWPRADFRLLNSAVMVTAGGDNDKAMSISLRDRGLLLDTTIIGTPIISGPNINKPKPILFGQVLNIDLTSYLTDPANLVYAINSYAMVDFTRVLDLRDSGISLQGVPFLADNVAMTANAGTDTITKVGHGLIANDVIYFSGDIFAGLEQMVQYWVIPTGLTTNDFKVSRTQNGTAEDITGTTFSDTVTVYKRRFLVDIGAATVQLVSKPGQLTADVRSTGLAGNALNQGVPHAGFQYILDTYTSLTAADRDQASFDVMVADETLNQIQWGYAVLDRKNVMDVLDEIATLTNSWYSWDYNGKLKVGKLNLQSLSTVTPIDTITEGDMEGDPSCVNMEIRFGRIIMDAKHNVAVQGSGLAAGVSAFDASKWSQDSQLRVQTTDRGLSQYADSWWRYHKTAVDSEPLKTSLYAQAPQAQTIVDERTALFKPYVRKFSCSVGLDKYQLNPGDPVLVKYPRYGLTAGKVFRVVSVNVRLTEKLVDLVLVTHADADALRASSYTVPDPPTNVIAVGGNAQATVTWTPPLADGGTSITEYLVTSSPGGIQARGLPLLVNGAMSMTVAGLANLTPYTFTVIATNSNGNSLPGGPSNAVTPDTTKFPPQAPTIGAVTRNNGYVDVTWAPPTDDGGAAISAYEILSTPGSFLAISTGVGGGYAARFPAATIINRASTASLNPGLGSWTVEGWVLPLDYTFPKSEFPWTKQGAVWNTTSGWGIGDGHSGTGIEFFFCDGTNNVTGTIACDPGYQPNDFLGIVTHIAVVFNRALGTARAHINGVLQSGSVNIAAVTGSVSNSNNLNFGNSVGWQFDGYADELRIWNVARSATQIADYYVKRATGAEQNLVLCYHLDEGTSTLAHDATAAQLDGTMSGGTSWLSRTTPVTGLINGTPYKFKVRAKNVIGYSAYSGDSAFATPATIPGVPRNLVASAGNAQVFASFAAPLSNGGDAITSYTVELRKTSDNSLVQTSAGSLALSRTFSGLVNGTAYYCKAWAINTVGVGPTTANSNNATPLVTLNPPDTPGAPSGTRGNAQVALTWGAPGDGGSPIIDYTVTTYQAGNQVASVVVTGTSTTITGLQNGIAYTFQVSARNAIGSSANSASSAAVTPATLPSAAGAFIQATAGNAQATVQLGAFSDGGDACTQVRITATPGGQFADVSNPATAAIFGSGVTITGLTNGVQYTFKAVPTNSLGAGTSSGASNSVTPIVPQHQVSAGDVNGFSLQPTKAGGSSTASVTGGIGPFTFSWAFVVDGNGITLTNALLQTVTARTNTGTPQVRQGTLRVTVTDTGNGNLQVTKDVGVYLEVDSGN